MSNTINPGARLEELVARLVGDVRAVRLADVLEVGRLVAEDGAVTPGELDTLERLDEALARTWTGAGGFRIEACIARQVRRGAENALLDADDDRNVRISEMRLSLLVALVDALGVHVVPPVRSAPYSQAELARALDDACVDAFAGARTDLIRLAYQLGVPVEERSGPSRSSAHLPEEIEAFYAEEAKRGFEQIDWQDPLAPVRRRMEQWLAEHP